MHNLIVIGAGPAGLAAAITASEKGLSVLLLAKEFSPQVFQENNSKLAARNLHNQFEAAQKQYSRTLEVQLDSEVLSLEKNVVSFSAEAKSGQLYYAKAVIICSGRQGQTGEGNTAFDLLTFKDPSGRIKTDSQMATNVPGVFAAGSVTAPPVADFLVCMGEGARAAWSAAEFIRK